ncbi:MAG TPA: DUF2357 domain-containing protein [Natronosporangium sp.]
MRNSLVLRVQTSGLLVEIRGPRISEISYVGVPRLACLSISGVSDVSVQWWDAEGHTHTAIDGTGPHLFEDVTYRIRVKSLIAGQQPKLSHRNKALLRQIDRFPDDRTLSGPINFGRQVGLTDFEISVANESVSMTLEVFPRKLDYVEDYAEMLSAVSSASRALALAYLRSTYRSGSTVSGEQSDLEWLTLLRQEVRNLTDALRFINEHPHRALRRDLEFLRAEKIRRADSWVRRAVVRRAGRGQLQNVRGLGPVREILPSGRAQETLDNPENRWLKTNLSLVRRRLTDIARSVERELRRFGQSGGNRTIQEAVHGEVSQLGRQLDRLLSLPFLQDVQGGPSRTTPSLTLLSAPGYSEAYRSMMVLLLGLMADGEPYDLSVKDVHELYEIWCFLQVVQITGGLIAGDVSARESVKITQNGVRVSLARDKDSAITFSGAGREVEIRYNPSYPGLTGEQRPDIVITLRQSDWPPLVVVLDAKYRVDASVEYSRTFGCAGPPQDSINALHRYRDAIVFGDVHTGMKRPVVRCAALYPLSARESEAYSRSVFVEALDHLGVGALPFLPGNTGYVRDWLQHVLHMPIEKLAVPGPAFSGLEALAFRHQAKP